jgi:hypothetical protein
LEVAVLVTHPEKVRESHRETLLGLGFTQNGGHIEVHAMVDKWERDAEGKVLKRIHVTKTDGSKFVAVKVDESGEWRRFWLADGTAQIMKVEEIESSSRRGVVRELDGSSLHALVKLFKTLVANKQVIGYGQKVALPDGKTRFGTLLVKSAFLQSARLRSILGFDPTALVVKTV